MFILEEPYVSKLLLETLEKCGLEVLENDFIKNAGKGYALNLVKMDAVKALSDGLFDDLKFYSNSENSINWVLENFPNSGLARLISLCKDKVKFREALKSIYPDFLFKEVCIEELGGLSRQSRANIGDVCGIKFSDIKKPFIIKPSVGFLSLGVHKVRSESEFDEVKKQIGAEIDEISKLFPKSVLNISKFIIEEMIEGTEFAVDVYYDASGRPNVLNILKHPFSDGDDVSDRAYITSRAIIEENLERFEEVLIKIGKTLDIRNFPMHIELIKRVDGEVIPVEINPMRFAGWCTTDLAHFAFGINVYEYFEKGTKPDWKTILANKGDEIYYFAIAERPKNLADAVISGDTQNAGKKHGAFGFDYEKLYQNFSNILEKREIDYTKKPVCAILFGSTKDSDEINKILKLDMKSFVKGA